MFGNFSKESGKLGAHMIERFNQLNSYFWKTPIGHCISAYYNKLQMVLKWNDNQDLYYWSHLLKAIKTIQIFWPKSYQDSFLTLFKRKRTDGYLTIIHKKRDFGSPEVSIYIIKKFKSILQLNHLINRPSKILGKVKL